MNQIFLNRERILKEVRGPMDKFFNSSTWTGWRRLFEEAASELEPLGAENITWKEKWGEMRIHFFFDGDRVVHEKLTEIARKYGDRSEEICERCGAPGDLEKLKNGWLKTLCPSCREFVDT